MPEYKVFISYCTYAFITFVLFSAAVVKIAIIMNVRDEKPRTEYNNCSK